MLRKDVVTAVRQGKFHDLGGLDHRGGAEVLTGEAAGERGADGVYPADSIYGRVDARLLELAESVRRFGDADHVHDD